MRNPELAIRKIEQIENKLKAIKFQISRNTEINDVYSTIDMTGDILEDLKSLINRP